MTSPILLNSLISWVRIRANSRFRQRLHAILANRQNNLLSKHPWHKDCFNCVDSETINYVFNALTLMAAATQTMAAQRHTALFIFSSQGVTQWRKESLFLLPASTSPSVFSGWGGGGRHHLLLGILQQVLSLSGPCSIPLEKSGDNAGLSGRGGGGETGSL